MATAEFSVMVFTVRVVGAWQVAGPEPEQFVVKVVSVPEGEDPWVKMMAPEGSTTSKPTSLS